MNCKINTFFKQGKDYSITDLCSNVGISRTHYYKILSNSSCPSLDVAMKITKYFNMLNREKHIIETAKDYDEEQEDLVYYYNEPYRFTCEDLWEED